jgi:phage anti-repressor protein
MTDHFNIIHLIEKNAKTRFSKDYQSELVNKIKKKFWEREQQFFAANLYCLLNYSKSDFIVDLDDVWKWLGYIRTDPAKRLLERSFSENIDYIKVQSGENAKNGKQKEQILLTTTAFRKLCMKAETYEGDKIADFYIKLEDFLFEIINEETSELKEQMKIKDQQILKQEEELKKQEEELKKQEEELKRQREEFKKQEEEFIALTKKRYADLISLVEKQEATGDKNIVKKKDKKNKENKENKK